MGWSRLDAAVCSLLRNVLLLWGLSRIEKSLSGLARDIRVVVARLTLPIDRSDGVTFWCKRYGVGGSCDWPGALRLCGEVRCFRAGYVGGSKRFELVDC